MSGDERIETRKAGSGRLMSISDLATECGVSTRAIRFYEDQGLIAPERVGGNRIYTTRDRARLHWILRGRRLGFSLAEIRALLDLYDVDRTQVTQLQATLARGNRRIQELQGQLDDIRQALGELTALRDEIISLLEAKGVTAADNGANTNQVSPRHAGASEERPSTRLDVEQ